MEPAGIVPEQQRNSPGTPMEQSENTAESVQPVPPEQETDLFDEFSESSELVASQGFEAIGCNEFKRRYGINNHQFYELKDALGVKDTSCGLSSTLHRGRHRLWNFGPQLIEPLLGNSCGCFKQCIQCKVVF